MKNSLKGGRDSAVRVGEGENVKRGVNGKFSIKIWALKSTVYQRPTIGQDRLLPTWRK